MPFRILLSTCCFIALAVSARAADPVRPSDLISEEAALVLQVRQPKAAWNEFRRGELFHRFEQSALHERLAASEAFQKWQGMQRGVAEATGAALSDQILDLCGQELVLAVYLSDTHEAEGVLLTRAEDAATVPRILQNWQRLEPQATVTTLKHQGHSYFRRSQTAARKPMLFYTRFGDIFALSDQEARIRQVIELHGSDEARRTSGLKRFRDTDVFRRAEIGSGESPPMARLLLAARAWDKTLHDAAPADEGAAVLERFWPAIDVISVELRTEQGLQLEARMRLNPDHVDQRWQDWSASPPSPDEFLSTVPRDAVLVAAGGIRVPPLWNLIHDLSSPAEKENWHQARRVIQGFLGGRDLMNDVLPALSRNVGLYLTVSPEKKRDVPLDGVLVCRFPEDASKSGLHLALDQAFAAGLTLLSIQVNEKHPDSDPATVHSEIADGAILRWLDTPLPMRVAYQLTPDSLTVSRSVEALRRHLSGKSTASADTLFSRLRERWFPKADQFLCVDVRGLRQQLPAKPTPTVLAKPGESVPTKIDLPRQLLRLCDSAFFATQFEPDEVTLRAGILAESAN